MRRLGSIAGIALVYVSSFSFVVTTFFWIASYCRTVSASDTLDFRDLGITAEGYCNGGFTSLNFHLDQARRLPRGTTGTTIAGRSLVQI